AIIPGGQPGAVATPVQERSVQAQDIQAIEGGAPPQVARQAPPAAMGIGGSQQAPDRVIETPPPAPAAIPQVGKATRVGAGSEREAIDKAITSRMRNFYMDRGQVDLAVQWDKFAEGQQGRRQIKAFSGALQAYSAGNMQGFV